jgi:hypothetical protein
MRFMELNHNKPYQGLVAEYKGRKRIMPKEMPGLLENRPGATASDSLVGDVLTSPAA